MPKKPTSKSAKKKATGAGKKNQTIKLSLRERRLIKYLTDGSCKTQEEAFLKAGFAKSTAKKGANQILGKSRLQEGLQKALEKQGINDERLSAKISEGLDSTKVISANVIAKDGEGMADAHSMTKDFVEVPDYATQHKYLDTALKLRGDYPNEKMDHEHTGEIILSWQK